MRPPGPLPAPDPPAARDAPAGCCDVLIVEDAVTTRHLMARLLRRRGLVARAVGSAEEALEALSAGCRPAVALVDHDLPGMNGLDLIARMRKAVPGLRPVLITAAGPERVAASGLAPIAAAGRSGTAYFRKPIAFDRLMLVIEVRPHAGT